MPIVKDSEYEESDSDRQTKTKTTARENGDVEVSYVEDDEVEDYDGNVYPQDVAVDMSENVEKTALVFRARDHHSNYGPSSKIQVDGTDVQVFPIKNHQFVLECTSQGDVRARTTKDGSFGFTLLRGFYGLVALLMTGFLLVFSLQIILFLFLGLVSECGLTSNREFVFPKFAVTLLSIPLWTDGLASVMTFASTFVNEAFSGHKFINTIGGWNGVWIDWIVFTVNLLVPLLVGSFTLLFRMEQWLVVTELVWLGSVFVFFVVFSMVVVYCEVSACLGLVRSRFSVEGNVWQVILRSILIRQTQRCSVKRRVSYSTDRVFKKLGQKESRKETDFFEYYGLHAIITKLLTFRAMRWLRWWWTLLEAPIPQYDAEDVREQTPLGTAETWSLEGLYCYRSTRMVFVTKGPSALRPSQILSSVICSLLGVFICILLVVSLFQWFELPPVCIFVVSMILALSSYQSVLRSYHLYKLSKKLSLSEASFRVEETERVFQATPLLCWTMWVLEILCLFFIPMVGLYMTQNYEIAILFTCLTIMELMRRNLNVARILCELGALEVPSDDNSKDETDFDNNDSHGSWEELHRLNLIVGKISQGRRLRSWTFIFGVVVLVFCTLFLAALALGSSEGDIDSFQIERDFVYDPKNPYATCRMDYLAPAPIDLADYVYLSNVAYFSPDITQSLLDQWFGSNVTVDRHDIVREFQGTYRRQSKKGSSVAYKLIQFPSENSYVVTIRGTHNAWDALTDAQLWSGAALAQTVRFAVPFGALWTPIFEHLLWFISRVESNELEKVSYYTETTRFLEQLRLLSEEVTVTGHSLGGGLAMISGAQTDTQAIALSGPNHRLSRLTFVPPISLSASDKTFNVVPDRDPVPRSDDSSGHSQRIKCTAPVNSLGGCHSALRSLCEILVHCGSVGRGVPCDCVHVYGYPSPRSLGTRTFDEACPKYSS